jgi:uncharacterized membrane-anchored protein
MKKQFFSILLICCYSFLGFAQQDSAATVSVALDSIKRTFNYQTGSIKLGDNLAEINVPKGFKYLDSQQTSRVLIDLWGNPKETVEGTLGMLIPEQYTPIDKDCWVFNITYETTGYVKDDDADDIDYTELLEQMQEDTKTESEERVKQGYESIALVGWAAAPFYDKEKKVLHWAKEIKFGTTPTNTLNYNIRVLGRKGVLVINAIGEMGQLPIIQPHVPAMTTMLNFSEGSRYSDFNPDIDKVAAYGIGGLIAGKILSKVGLFAIAAKFWKVIIAAIVAGGGFLWNFITGKKAEPKVEETSKEQTPKDDSNKDDTSVVS